MSDTSLILSLPYIQPAQAQKHVTHNEALRLLDMLVQPAVLNRTLAAPPAALVPGDRHIVGAGASGDWAGQEGRIALWTATGWQFFAPQPGWQCYVLAEGATVVWSGTAWQVLARLVPEFDMLGIATTADAVNRLAVAAPATLLTHAGAGHQVKVNKASAGDTASLLFQTGWSGRAEMGLAGNDDFAIKVSPNGSAFYTGLQVAAATGHVSVPQNLNVGGLLGGGAVQASATDATAGRVLTVGAFGLGGLAPVILDAGVTDNSIVPGFYSYISSMGSTGAPAGVVRGALLHQRRSIGGGETQMLIVESGTGASPSGILFSRSRVTGAWGAWFSGGVVEGASNANGRYIRLQDGTQTCWQTVTTLTTAEVAATFPAAFSSTTNLATVTGVNASGSTVIAPRVTARTAIALNLSAFNSSNARVAAQIDLITIGRWY